MMKEFAMHILDIAQNSIRADATRILIEVNEDIVHNKLSFFIEDNGKGMSAETIAAVRDPFATSRTTRKVGLGIPFLEQTCIQCGGKLDIDSTPGIGTKLTATLDYNNIDRPPMGDMAGSVHILIVMNTQVDFIYTHIVNGNEYIMNTADVKEVLDGVPLDEPEIMAWLKENIYEGLQEIGAI